VFERIANEAARLATQHLAGLNPRRRHAVLAAGAIVIEEALTDATLEMFEKLMASLGRTAERKADERAARSMRDVQADLRVFALSGRALIEARNGGADLGEAINEAGTIRTLGVVVKWCDRVYAEPGVKPPVQQSAMRGLLW
jgi:hypothetical protein